jgi:hypothetical protein
MSENLYEPYFHDVGFCLGLGTGAGSTDSEAINCAEMGGPCSRVSRIVRVQSPIYHPGVDPSHFPSSDPSMCAEENENSFGPLVP